MMACATHCERMCHLPLFVRDIVTVWVYKKPIKRMIARSYSVVYASKAAKQLRKIRISESMRILQACAKLAHFPDCTNVKALTQHRYGYRLRVGMFRVFFDVDDTVRIVSIEEVRKRDEHTY